jgi:hypothetical protein
MCGNRDHREPSNPEYRKSDLFPSEVLTGYGNEFGIGHGFGRCGITGSQMVFGGGRKMLAVFAFGHGIEFRTHCVFGEHGVFGDVADSFDHIDGSELPAVHAFHGAIHQATPSYSVRAITSS